MVENAFDFNTDTEESRQDMLVPMELYKISYMYKMQNFKTQDRRTFFYASESTSRTLFLVLKVQRS